MENGWDESAAAWIAVLAERGDWSREFVLDPAMTARAKLKPYRRALDVGCGEGRFCRILQGLGVETVGLDPTEALIAEAQRRDPKGHYEIGSANALPFDADAFDLVVSYLTLVDIEAYRTAIKEMARVLQPGGRFLIANLAGFVSANPDKKWLKDETGRKVTYRVDNYLIEHPFWLEWSGIRIRNWHRPLSAYMRAFLENGLALVHFDEPPAVGADEASTEEQNRVPLFVVMEWRKPAP